MDQLRIVDVGEGLSVTVPSDQAADVENVAKTLTELYNEERRIEEWILTSFPKSVYRSIATRKLRELMFWLSETVTFDR